MTGFKTTTIDDLFPSRFLKVSDLMGQRRVLTISKITSEEIGREKTRKPVVYFQKCTKGLPLNKTNGKKIAEVVGSKFITDWPGKQIALYPKPDVEFAGQVGPAIRVDYPTPNGITRRAADENSVPTLLRSRHSRTLASNPSVVMTQGATTMCQSSQSRRYRSSKKKRLQIKGSANERREKRGAASVAPLS